MRFTASEKRRAAQREVEMRRHVYPNRVAAGKMTQTLADRSIAVMEEIAADYAALEAKQSTDLFDAGGRKAG